MGRHDREPNQPQEKLAHSLATLEAAVTAIQDGATFRRYLEAQARFHRYSWGNVLLILAQRPDATRVAGFRSWQRMNRYVRRGETGIKILVPMTRRVTQETPEERSDDDAEADQRRVFFGVGHVFDVSQTEGESLPRVEVPVLQGDEGADLYGHLAGVAAAEGVSIEQVAQLRGEMMGYYEPPTGRIVLRQAPQRQMTKTLAHELGHHFSGTTESSPEEETLAESVVYVVCSRFGLDTGERSFPYIAIWSRQPRVFRAALTRIQAISSEIIGRIEPRGLELSGE
jgi:antirestriction protein ArdC